MGVQQSESLPLIEEYRAMRRWLTRTPLEKFSALRPEADPAVCWEWLGVVDEGGYGQMHWRGANVGTHRIAYELHHGQVPPDGLVVCHECDNRKCCNPHHLFLGTPNDNVQDARRKGKILGRPKAVSRELVPIVRAYLMDGHSLAEAHRHFGISRSVIGRFFRGVGYPRPEGMPRWERTDRVLLFEDVRAILDMTADGMTQRAIARAVGVDSSVITRIQQGKTHQKHVARAMCVA